MNDSFLNHAGKRRTGDAAKTDPVCRAGRRGELAFVDGRNDLRACRKNGVDFACMDDRAERCCGGDLNGLVWAAFDAYQKRRKKSDAVFYSWKAF